METHTYTIDGKNFSNFGEFINEFNIKVFGDDRTWGGNLDQLDDELRGGFGINPPYIIRWINSRKSQKDLGHKALWDWLMLGRRKIHPSNTDTWNRRIELAEQNQGETMFTMLIQIIIGNDGVSLFLE